MGISRKKNPSRRGALRYLVGGAAGFLGVLGLSKQSKADMCPFNPFRIGFEVGTEVAEEFAEDLCELQSTTTESEQDAADQRSRAIGEFADSINQAIINAHNSDVYRDSEPNPNECQQASFAKANLESGNALRNQIRVDHLAHIKARNSNVYGDRDQAYDQAVARGEVCGGSFPGHLSPSMVTSDHNLPDEIKQSADEFERLMSDGLFQVPYEVPQSQTDSGRGELYQGARIRQMSRQSALWYVVQKNMARRTYGSENSPRALERAEVFAASREESISALDQLGSPVPIWKHMLSLQASINHREYRRLEAMKERSVPAAIRFMVYFEDRAVDEEQDRPAPVTIRPATRALSPR
ncbi:MULTISPECIES: hypothetical protein [unclassified Thioalkalivibrio]|uniref:hypothetical protein n=1 Tax=unclassified Thioalkalivibrio TaxID=2621013 RepID=UPI00035ED7CD|nr:MULTISPECIES: hypothetical protein [unclassified Thioalkalivibrio]